MGHLFFITFSVTKFLSDPGIPSPIYGSNSLSQTETPFADLTDVTLVMKIPTPKAGGCAILTNADLLVTSTYFY